MSARTVQVRTAAPYELRLGRGIVHESMRAAREYSAAAVLSDDHVWKLHGDKLQAGDARVVIVPQGERSKSFEQLERVLDALAEVRLDRRSCLVAFGGGVVGDLGGLASALFMRGIDVLQCPTTLLAQVDSSVGGKTAVNLRSGKNLAGAFHQPAGVWIDVDLLTTLDDQDYASGLGEVVKSAVLAGEADFARLEQHAEALLRRDPDLLLDVVEACVRQKAAVVESDEREAGPRRALNLGHTLGHAIERAAGYGRIPHGVAVAVGMLHACVRSAHEGVLQDRDLPARIRRLCARLGLPTGLDELRTRSGAALSEAELADAMQFDKKGALWILPVRLGEVRAVASKG
ncbi:MAG: 3-dehydroquinate synthase [Planctomycetes bacterium]|nr:3-dehydroquinate synthase [Planctomycetota bacterium]MCB9904984.1 3-dehydroquinate synthase [Planctomycetota bacterium]